MSWSRFTDSSSPAGRAGPGAAAGSLAAGAAAATGATFLTTGRADGHGGGGGGGGGGGAAPGFSFPAGPRGRRAGDLPAGPAARAPRALVAMPRGERCACITSVGEGSPAAPAASKTMFCVPLENCTPRTSPWDSTWGAFRRMALPFTFTPFTPRGTTITLPCASTDTSACRRLTAFSPTGKRTAQPSSRPITVGLPPGPPSATPPPPGPSPKKN